MVRYPIDKTSINLNLTKITHPTTLSRHALLALVEWVSKNKKRGERVEFHGMGADTIGKSQSIDQSIGEVSREKVENSNKGSDKSCCTNQNRIKQ